MLLLRKLLKCDIEQEGNSVMSLLQLKYIKKGLQDSAEPIYISVSEKVFKYPFNPALIHQVVSSYLINARQGSKAQKSRAEVKGSGKKPWRQKGTGRARSGSVKSPIWRSGGVTFASKPKEYYKKINKKMYKRAIKSILSKLVADGRLFLIDDLYLKQPKTKFLLKQLKSIILNKTVFIVMNALDKNLILASRNLYKIVIKDIAHIDPINLIKSEMTLFTTSAISEIEKKLI